MCVYIYREQLIIIVTKQIKKNRLSLPLQDTPTHIPGVGKCSQFSKTDQAKPSSSYCKQSISISLATTWIKVLFILVLHLDCFRRFVITNTPGTGILAHMPLYD